MANLAQAASSFRDVSHITKFNGSNFFDWRYEFVGIMEQLGIKNLIEVADGQLLCTIPDVVSFLVEEMFYIAFYILRKSYLTTR